MRSIFRTGLLIICAALAACCSAPPAKSPDSATGQKELPVVAQPFPKIDLWLTDNKLAVNAGQSKNFEYDKAFEQGVVLVYGEGYPMAGAEGVGQKRLTATRAAEVTAKRNLAEYFARYATNGEIRFSTYTSRLEAFIKGAEVAASEYNPDLEKAVVLLKLDLKGAKGFAK